MKLWADAFRQGRLKLKKGFHTEPVTFHDSCNFIRNAGYYEESRLLMNHVSADFREMNPRGVYALCCANGGGHVQMPEYKKKYRLPSTKKKAEQIAATGAKLCVVCCHNCEDGIRDCIAEWGLDVKVMLMSEYIAEAIDLPEVEEGGEE